MDEKRYFSRINFTARTQIEFNDNVYEGELLDLSLKGALLGLKDQVPLKLNDRCVIKISLHSSDIKLVFDAELTHIHKNNLGFKFLGEDVETMTHLRNLLSLNVGDYDKITDELDFLLKE
ncbi:MAG: PilZ domain-containing protein [Candidatus Scalindua sp.]